MLGKLFKHELKDTGKVLLPLNLALIGITIIGMIMIRLNVFDTNSMAVGILLIASAFVYVFGILALFIITYVYLMVRFYRSMYSSEGYLTHTLPVSTLSILNTKIFVSAFWAFITMILTVSSILLLAVSVILSLGEPVSLSDVLNGFETAVGMPVGPFIAWMLLFMLVSSFSGLLTIYCSISIGQLFNKYKVLAAIVTYVIIYIVLQIISLIVSMAGNLQGFTKTDIYLDNGVMTFSQMFGDTFTYSIVQSVIMIILFYLTTAFISQKKLNLD